MNNKIKDFLVTLLIAILILGAGKWTWDQYFSQPNVSPQPKVVATPPAPPATPPTQPTWKSDKDFNGPSIADAKRMFGVDVVRVGTELSCFTWRGIPNSTELRLDKEFIFTLHLPDDRVVVVLGNDKIVKVKAFTARHLATYPSSDAIHRPEILAEKESRHMMGNVVFVKEI